MCTSARSVTCRAYGVRHKACGDVEWGLVMARSAAEGIWPCHLPWGTARLTLHTLPHVHISRPTFLSPHCPPLHYPSSISTTPHHHHPSPPLTTPSPPPPPPPSTQLLGMADNISFTLGQHGYK